MCWSYSITSDLLLRGYPSMIATPDMFFDLNSPSNYRLFTIHNSNFKKKSHQSIFISMPITTSPLYLVYTYTSSCIILPVELPSPLMMQASVELNQNCVAHCDDKCSLTIKHVHAALIAKTTMQLLLVKDWIYIMSTKPAFYHHEAD